MGRSSIKILSLSASSGDTGGVDQISGDARVCAGFRESSPNTVWIGRVEGREDAPIQVVAEVDDRRQPECRAGMSPPARLFFARPGQGLL